MKVMINGRVLLHPEVTGVERYTIELIRTLRKLNTPEFIFKIAMPQPGNRIVHHLWEWVTLPRLAEKEKVDILFCPANLGPLFKGRFRIVITLHSLAYQYLPEAYSWDFRYYYSLLHPFILRRADAIITVSHSEKIKILNRYPFLQEKIFPIYNGIDAFWKKDKNPSLFDFPYLLFVGSLHAGKNVKGILEAYLLVCKKHNVKLIICGKMGKIFKRGKGIDSLMDKLPPGNVRFLGHLHAERLRNLYSHAIALVLPSFYEACAFPPLEAMACGCPVIVSNIPPLREVCSDAGYYVNPYSAESIAEGIIRILENGELREELIKKGLDRVRKFTWQKSAKEHIRVLEEVIKR